MKLRSVETKKNWRIQKRWSQVRKIQWSTVEWKKRVGRKEVGGCRGHLFDLVCLTLEVPCVYEYILKTKRREKEEGHVAITEPLSDSNLNADM